MTPTRALSKPSCAVAGGAEIY